MVLSAGATYENPDPDGYRAILSSFQVKTLIINSPSSSSSSMARPHYVTQFDLKLEILPASVFGALGLQVCTTTQALKLLLFTNGSAYVFMKPCSACLLLLSFS